ncbi:MAG: hypothetical protein HUU20_26215, partial [Pirellulales bacterium]|nr:hypothetical protein [Pirellulales bacterium]
MAGSEERETADVLWEAYRNGGRGERIRDEIVEHYFALVRPMAAGMLRRLPRGADAHAIESAAAEGLIEAVERFDPGRKRDFAGYARLVMRCRV